MTLPLVLSSLQEPGSKRKLSPENVAAIEIFRGFKTPLCPQTEKQAFYQSVLVLSFETPVFGLL